MKILPILCSLALGLSAKAETLALYDFDYDENPSEVASLVSTATAFVAIGSTLKGPISDVGNPAPSYMADAWINGLNFVNFVLTIAPGYALTVDELTFDYRSDSDGEWQGPTNYNVLIGPQYYLGHSLSGGWQPLVRDNDWHSAPPAQNSGAVTPFLTGAVAFRIHGQGASTNRAFWFLDNIVARGALTYDPPRVAAMTQTASGIELTLGLGMTGLTYQVEQAADASLGAWTNLHSFIGCGPSTNWMAPPGADAESFYRVRIRP